MAKSHGGNIDPIFIVGIADEPKDDDEDFTTEIEAIGYASSLAKMPGNYREPIAVWSDNGDILYLFMCGQKFRSV